MCLWRNGNAVGCGPTYMGSIPIRHPIIKMIKYEDFKKELLKDLKVKKEYYRELRKQKRKKRK